ncbi:nucleotidyltransferase domain-containing protein [Bacillus sp. JJ722]|uniref:nucleotidyltransferase domain-containing protein n=1 Tax=Bacillus sp. JJ722 TaxID=3122973 RepID=UPI002FFDC59B
MEDFINFDIVKWTNSLKKELLIVFSNRIQFIGLQGSYQRGEATTESDIDIVVVLDHLHVDDLKLYKKLISDMPYHHKACGFICGKNELMDWPRYDLFQLYHDTKPLHGSMVDLIPEIKDHDILESVLIGAANLYHASTHSYIYGKNNVKSLKKLLKNAFFILQAKFRLETGKYVNSKHKLLDKLSGLDKEILKLLINIKTITNLSDTEIDQSYENLMNWCQNILNQYQIKQSFK